MTDATRPRDRLLANTLLSLLLLGSCVVAACAGDGGDDFAASAPDAQTIENPELDPEATPRWRLSGTPVWEIAGGTGEEPRLSGVSGGALLPGGGAVLTSYATRDVRFYDAEGRLERTAEESGDSLELETPMFVGLFGGDSSMVTDARQRRAFVVSRNGTIARSFRPASDTSLAIALVIGVLESGRALVYEGPDYELSSTRTGVQRVPAPIHVADSEGRIEKQLGRFDGGEVSLLIEGERMTASPVAFGSDFFLAARGDRVAAGNSEELAVHVYDHNGEPLHTVRQSRQPVRIPRGQFDRFMVDALSREQDPSARLAAEQRFRQMPRRETYPAFSSLRFDAEQNLWVEEYRAPGQTQSRWLVFDPSGRIRAYLDTPIELILLDIGAETALALVRDASGDRLRLYGLEKGS